MSEDKKKFDKVNYNNEYNKTAYDRVSLMLPKGKKEQLKTIADRNGESVNAFINRAIDKAINEAENKGR